MYVAAPKTFGLSQPANGPGGPALVDDLVGKRRDFN